jgi:hypothetical protein
MSKLERQFIKLTEHNDWEGESWNFYFPKANNEEALDFILSKIVNNEEYEIAEETIAESEVDILVKHTDSGYMDYENKVNGILDINKLKSCDWENDNPLYKGNLYQFLKK